MHFLAASMPPPQGIEDILTRFLPYQALGFLVVLVALSALFGLCAFAGWCFAVSSRRTAPASSPVAENDPRIVAAIAAAVSVALKHHNHHIVDIAPAAKLTPMTSAWAIEGRFQHFSSHKFR
jgi:Na+-transporting methylmalonyl-CoA/oxaloacetate decarboxylase gamma subunit